MKSLGMPTGGRTGPELLYEVPYFCNFLMLVSGRVRRASCAASSVSSDLEEAGLLYNNRLWGAKPVSEAHPQGHAILMFERKGPALVVAADSGFSWRKC